MDFVSKVGLILFELATYDLGDVSFYNILWNMEVKSTLPPLATVSTFKYRDPTS